jgi:hypothetical protein
MVVNYIAVKAAIAISKQNAILLVLVQVRDLP